jgi:hypothetical protein
LPAAVSKECRNVLPSMATNLPPVAVWTASIQWVKQRWKAWGSRRLKTRPKVSWLGTPLGKGKKVLSQSNFLRP